MTEGDALYQSILEYPEDDAPRLIYSDWLEEQGDTQRAAFIRVQCELARSEPFSPAYRRLFAKSRRLFKPEWAQTLKGKILHAEMHRGFIRKVTMYSKRFVMEASEIFDREPIQEVKFADYSAVRGNVPVVTLALCKELNRLKGVTLSGIAVTGRMVDTLLDGGNLINLENFQFEGTRIEPGLYRQIFNSARLPRLQELGFAFQPDYGVSWIDDLAGSNLLAQLEVLSLRYPSASANEICGLISNRALTNLKSLAITSCTCEPLLRMISECPHLTSLTDLDLSITSVTDASLAAFVENDEFNQLKRLNLPMNRISNTGVQSLLKAEQLRELFVLNLDANLLIGKSRWKEQLREWCPKAIVSVR